MCSIIRLCYTIELYRTNDITYLVEVLEVWNISEVAAGILCQCLPVLPKFFQELKETKAFSKIGTSLKSFLNFTIFANKRSTDNGLAESNITMNGPTFRNTRVRPNHYESLPGGQPLANSSNKTSSDPTLGVNEHHQPDTYIVRTIDNETHSESKAHNGSYSANGIGEIWQGDDLYNTNVEVERLPEHISNRVSSC